MEDQIIECNVLEQKMIRDTRAEILRSASWLTAARIVANAGPSIEVTEDMPMQWLHQRRIFALFVQGQLRYPRYALDAGNGWRPYPIVAEILEVFDAKFSAWELAGWFAGTNSWLGGARPADLIRFVEQRELLVGAARQETNGCQHG